MTEDFQGNETTPYNTIMVDTCHLSRTVEYVTPRVSHSIKSGPGVIMMDHNAFEVHLCFGGC